MQTTNVNRQIGGKESAEKSAAAARPYNRADASVDLVYEALGAHRAACVVCEDDDGQVSSVECAVGEALTEAWGLTEGFRDDFYAARRQKQKKDGAES